MSPDVPTRDTKARRTPSPERTNCRLWFVPARDIEARNVPYAVPLCSGRSERIEIPVSCRNSSGCSRCSGKFWQSSPALVHRQLCHQHDVHATVSQRWIRATDDLRDRRFVEAHGRYHSSDASRLFSKSQFVTISRADCARCAGTVMRCCQLPSGSRSKRPQERIAPSASSSRSRPRAMPS